jgi:hypothetical protein
MQVLQVAVNLLDFSKELVIGASQQKCLEHALTQGAHRQVGSSNQVDPPDPAPSVVQSIE